MGALEARGVPIFSQSLKALTSHVIYNWSYTSRFPSSDPGRTTKTSGVVASTNAASYTCRQLLNTGLSVTSLGEVKMLFPWCTNTQEEEGLC